AVLTAVGKLQASGGTAMYDAVQVSLRALGPTGVRSIVLLSDGQNSAGKAKLGDTVTAVRHSQAALDAVTFRTGEADGALNQLTTAGLGQLVATKDAAGLSQVFKQSAQAL